MKVIEDSGIVEVALKDFPVLVVNVLKRLGYDNIPISSNALDQIIAVQKVDEQIGKDWWRSEYRVTLRWTPATDGVLVELALEESKGGATKAQCQKRSDIIFNALEQDAARLAQVASYKVPSTMYGSARWGTQEDLKNGGYIVDKADSKRFILGRTLDKKYIQVPENETYAHAIVCGRTGVGKSTGFFIPQLVERLGTSMVVTEATPGPEDGELYRLTSGWRQTAGHKIYCFNSSDMSSHRFNPIDRIRNAPEEMKAKRARELAELVITNGQSSEIRGDTKMWNDAERLLLLSIMLHVAAGDPRYANFGAIRWLLLKGPNALEPILSRSPSEVAREEFGGWMRLAGETNFKYGVFSGLNTKFTPWQTDQIIALTEKTDIDLEAIKHELFTLYIAVNNRDSDSQLIGALLFNFFVEYLLEARYEMKHPMGMLLDEFTNFGKIQKISDFLSLVRKKKIGLVLGFQNFAQLEMIYSRKESQIILGQPKTQVYFRQKEYREARDLSEAIGRATVEERTMEDGGRIRESVQGRSLATPDELINLEGDVIVFTPTTRVLKLPLTAPDAYAEALAYPAPVRENHVVSEFIRKRGRLPEAPKAEPVAEPVAAAKVEPKPSEPAAEAPPTPKKPKKDSRPDRLVRERTKRPAPERQPDKEENEKPKYKTPLEDWD